MRIIRLKLLDGLFGKHVSQWWHKLQRYGKAKTTFFGDGLNYESMLKNSFVDNWMKFNNFGFHSTDSPKAFAEFLKQKLAIKSSGGNNLLGFYKI